MERKRMDDDFESRLHSIGRAFSGLRARKKPKRHEKRKGKRKATKGHSRTRNNLMHPREDNESADPLKDWDGLGPGGA